MPQVQRAAECEHNSGKLAVNPSLGSAAVEVNAPLLELFGSIIDIDMIAFLDTSHGTGG